MTIVPTLSADLLRTTMVLCIQLAFHPSTSQLNGMLGVIVSFIWDLLFTARVAKRAKVMFSQVFVILSLNRGRGVDQGPGHSPSLPLGPGHNTSLPLDKVITPPP